MDKLNAGAMLLIVQVLTTENRVHISCQTTNLLTRSGNINENKE